MASYETEEIDVAKEFNLLPVIFETIQALQRTSDPQELTKKVASEIFMSFKRNNCQEFNTAAINSSSNLWMELFGGSDGGM